MKIIKEMPTGWKLYIKTGIVKAIQMNEDFQVNTLEGTMKGKKGDYLLKGIYGELYPCKKDIFLDSYDRLRPFQKNKEEK